MGSLSIWHILLVLAVVVLLFGGRGKISGLMGDFAKGIKAFKSGMKEDEETPAPPPQQVTPPAAQTGAAASATERSAQHRT